MDYVLVSDLARYGAVVGSLLCVALILRGAQLRIRRHGWRGPASPHPATSAAFALGLTVGCFRRFDRLGQPGDVYLWAYCLLIVLLWWGLTRTLALPTLPPWRR